MNRKTSKNLLRGAGRKAALGVFILVVVGAWTAAGTESVPFVTGFESSETPAYTVGDLDGQGTAGSWTVAAGTVEVQTSLVARGVQAVALQADSSAEVAVTAGHNVVWTDVYLQTTGSVSEASIPGESAAAVLYFGETNGLWALDGNGAGTGTYVSVVNPFPTGRFVRVSIRQDFTARTYDVWIDGSSQVTNLGFKNSLLTNVSAVQVDAEGASYLDDVSVTEEGIALDTDSDHLVDLDEIKFYGTSPTNADTDADVMIDGDEVYAGTDPTNPASVLAASLSLTGTQVNVRFQTVTGRVYAVQQVTNLVSDTWTNAPGLGNIAGDGTEKDLPVDGTPPMRDFRISVSQP